TRLQGDWSSDVCSSDLDRDHEARGGRHYILQAQHVLSDAERASLASEGVTIQRGLPEGRYLVRVAAGSAFDDSDPRVRVLAPMRSEERRVGKEGRSGVA